jgi:hypothetical protein
VKITGALVQEQNVRFAVVLVKSQIMISIDREQMAEQSRRYFPGYNIVLMSQDSRGNPTFYGRRDIVRFLQNVPVNAFPWKEYTFAI